MERETLFTATKWEILKLLEEKPHSPTDLANALGSSLGNVSQQLRLLELAGIVTAERVSNRDKGQPRILYKLAGNLSYMIATSDNFVDKKIVQLSPRNKAVLRIWFLEDPGVRYALEKAFWEIESLQPDKVTYAGLEDGTPVLEVRGGKQLPKKVAVGGDHGNVTIRSVEEPVGIVLFERA